MTRREKQIREQLKTDYRLYAKNNLKIRVKKAVSKGENEKPEKIQPFLFNRAQEYIHQKVEEQKARTGRVRVMLLKGRQQGGSTYIGGRFYHKTTHRQGLKTFILTHKEDATNNLFAMVKRFHKHCNPLLKASTSHSNRKELVFDKLDSAYGLGTAGSGSVGRSDTIDLFHGSECAFWQNTNEIKTGILQAANEAEEIFFESTANGFDTFFYPMWREAQGGKSEYIAIFVPWYWQDEYTKEIGKDFELTAEEARLLAMYAEDGMSLENIAWRRDKLRIDFSGDETLFKQEYPCTPHEAFQVTGIESFIKPEPVLAARKRKTASSSGAHIVGIDPARGGDRTAFMHRKGKVMWKGPVIKTPDTKKIAGLIKDLFDNKKQRYPVDWVFIDVGGLGGPIYDFVKDLDFGGYVIPVNFGSEKDVYKKERYKNKRAEMIANFREWLEDDIFPASVPDDDDFQADVCAPSWTYDNEQRILIESKKDLKKRGIISTDLLDSAGLTFAQPMAKRHSAGVTTDDVPVLV